MAPIFSAIGITPQIIDDDRLRTLRSSIEATELKGPLNYIYCASEELVMPLDIERLVRLLEPWQSWTFEEQVNPTFCFKRLGDRFLVLYDLTLPSLFSRSTFKNGLES